MPIPPPSTRSKATLPVALALLVGTASAQALNDGTRNDRLSAGGVPHPTSTERTGVAPLGKSVSSATAALRMDNYVDVVDSVLNARVRARRAEIVLPPARDVDTAPSGVRTTRVVLPVHLPRSPLVVTTTAAFTGTGAPAGAASWPPASGQLSISAADGSRIELDADTGDIGSVNVTVISGTRLYVFRESWTTWAPYVLGGR